MGSVRSPEDERGSTRQARRVASWSLSDSLRKKLRGLAERATRRPLDRSAERPPIAKSLAELIGELPPERSAAVFTHASFANERVESYERLEFLGDSVLELAIAHTLYDRFPDFEEGQMAKLRSQVVSRASCAVVAAQLGLSDPVNTVPVVQESEIGETAT